jgi:hypothetical protein
LAESATWAIFGRAAADEEKQELAQWLASRDDSPDHALTQLLWSLATSSEFRFNH